jgi:cell division transport system permease protein
MSHHSKQSNSSSIGSKGQIYVMLHAQALFSSLGRLMRSPFTSAMTILVLAVTVTLAGSFYLLLTNAQQLTSGLEASSQISLFLKTSVTDEDGKKLAKQISGHALIERLEFISKTQAMDEFKAYSGFGDALNALESNPLPAVIQVLPKNTLTDEANIKMLMNELERYKQVDFVQLDMQWVRRLQGIIQLASRGVGLLNCLLTIAVIFITGNTIRLELQNRRDEVLIAKLVGATHAFVQRPFVYTGFWLGLLAGILAWLLISLMVVILQTPLEKLSFLYDSHFQILYLSATETIMLLILSACSGVLGAWIVLHYQLRQIKPE